MTQEEFHSYRFDSNSEPSDEQLDRLMENAAEKVRETNRESYEKFFAELRRASEEPNCVLNMEKSLKQVLTIRRGKGFSRSNLRYMRNLFIAFPKRETLSHKLTCSHK